jgi:hypothetical protein
MRHWTDQLSEYLDGTLAEDDRRSAEAHLAACAECAQTLDELRLVVDKARVLESRAPEVDLWPGIAARLEPRRVPLGQRIAAWVGSRRISFSLPQLAAATAAVAALAVGLSWIGFRQPSNPVATLQPATRSHTAPMRAPYETPPSGEAAEESHPRASTHGGPAPIEGRFASFDESRYDAAVADLQRVLNEHRSDLDTSTVRILEQNIAIIDHAVIDARRALEADPSNPYLNNHLADQMMRKIRLLQTAAEVVAAHS